MSYECNGANHVSHMPHNSHMPHIPKILHYVWIDFENPSVDAPLPEKHLRNLATCAAINSDYDVRVWNMSAILGLLNDMPEFDGYAQLLDAFRRSKPITMTDIARLAILYVHGGVYLDTDILCVAGLQPLISGANGADVLLPEASFSFFETVNNFFIASRPGSDFLLFCLQNVRPSHHVSLTAGPIFMSRCLNAYRGAGVKRDVPKSLVAILPRHLVNPCDVCGSCALDAPFLIHTSSNSWFSGIDAFAISLFCHRQVVCIAVVSIVCAILAFALWRRGSA